MVTVLRHNTAPHARRARCLQTRCSLTYYSRLSPSLPTLIARPHPPPLRSEFPRLVLWSLPMTSAPLPYRCSLQHAKTGALTTLSQIELPLCLLFSHLPALICFRCQAISRTFARGCDRSPCRRHGVSCRKALPPAARPKREPDHVSQRGCRSRALVSSAYDSATLRLFLVQLARTRKNDGQRSLRLFRIHFNVVLMCFAELFFISLSLDLFRSCFGCFELS